ncbi:MAG: MlaA family lipoprotein, partial [Dokdonella sp.]
MCSAIKGFAERWQVLASVHSEPHFAYPANIGQPVSDRASFAAGCPATQETVTMLQSLKLSLLRKGMLAAALLALAGCTIAKPRTDDPWQKFNRKVYAFNVKVDNAVIRPTAVAYRKITSPNVRRVLSNFFANVRMPITIANDALQGEIKDALKGTGRFVINTTVGFLGFF